MCFYFLEDSELGKHFHSFFVKELKARKDALEIFWPLHKVYNGFFLWIEIISFQCSTFLASSNLRTMDVQVQWHWRKNLIFRNWMLTIKIFKEKYFIPFFKEWIWKYLSKWNLFYCSRVYWKRRLSIRIMCWRVGFKTF